MLGIKVLSLGSLAVYSMFMMLGGMLVPFFYGAFFLNESISAAQIVGTVLLSLFIILPLSGKDSVPGIQTNYPSAENAAALYIIPGRGFRRKNILNRCPKSFEYKLLGNQKHRLYLVPLIAVYPLGIDRHK